MSATNSFLENEKQMMSDIGKAVGEKKNRSMFECVGLDPDGKLVRYNLQDKLKEAEDDKSTGSN